MELNYKTFGQGEPVIILHGLFGTLDNWQTLGRQLGEHFTVYLVDQRNHGRSPHDPLMNYVAMADDLHHFMETHWIFGACIVGHSMGGKTAMQLALHYPDMVNKLVVVDIAPRAYSGGHQEIFEALFSVDLARIDNRQDADDMLRRRIADEGIRQFLLKNLTRTREGGYAWKMNLEVLHAHYPDILSAIDHSEPFPGPALFVRGERSDYIREDDFAAIQHLFPNARLETVAGAGHWVHADAPGETLRLITRFLEE